MANYSELPIYKDTYTLVLDIFNLVKEYSKMYKYTLGNSLLNNSLLLLNHLYKANSTVDKMPHLNDFINTFEIIKVELRLSCDLYATTIKRQEKILLLMNKIGKQIHGWKKIIK